MSFFEENQNIFFVGIGGIGMSGLARLCKAKGSAVSGSDASESSTTNELEDEEIEVLIGHGFDNVPEDTELLVYSGAVPEDNPELVFAKENGIPMMTYFEALGEITRDYHLVAISGTHGKTTTTAMLALILETAGMDPTVIVGSKLKEFGGKNVKVGESDLFILEACEYKRNFLSLHPDLLGITNIDLDHLDYFKDKADYDSAFCEFAGQSQEVVWPEDTGDYEGEMGIPGEHNLMNAGLAAHLARRLGAPEDSIATALASYNGAWRRFELKGETMEGALVYDDYAHHPAEIVATLEAAREKYPEERIVVVFQPHQYSRTNALIDDFAQAFENADEVIIPNIYEARDSAEDKESVSVATLVDAISSYHDDVKDGEGLEQTAEYLSDTIQDGDVVFLMGAGDVGKIAEMLLR